MKEIAKSPTKSKDIRVAEKHFSKPQLKHLIEKDIIFYNHKAQKIELINKSFEEEILKHN
jgi:hypothetical protein